MIVNERVVDCINGIPCEIEYTDENGEIVGYWAYGSWDPGYPYRPPEHKGSCRCEECRTFWGA